MCTLIKHITKEVILLLVIVLPIFSMGQEKSTIQFIENKGQLPQNVDFLLNGRAGDIYLEGNCITYNLFEKGILSDIHLGQTSSDAKIKGHAYRVYIENSNNPIVQKLNKSSNYYNYFIGNQPDKWVSNVYEYDRINYQNIYSGIDISYYGYYSQLKYDFIVAPNANPNQIKLKYDGIDSLHLENGHAIVYTSIGTVIEQSPYAYQSVNGEKKQVICNYNLIGNQLSFNFPQGYDTTKELVIDPVLTFGTYTGSTATNFGCTATYDANGNMYVGGTVFSFGYPVTLGAFQTSMSGGTVDMAITKFNPDGTQLIYSTYLGGSGNEIPHSLVVNNNNELCILGTSGSSNFPVFNGYDNVFSGGPSLNFGNGYGFQYNTGCDIVIVKLSANGSNLLSGTFVGGTGNDGINKGSLLHYNYGDAFRGEIIVDDLDNIYVASTTNSTNFPVTSNAVQPSFAGGNLDACVFKLSANLSSLIYASYIGGNSFDCAYSVQLGNNGDMYITGGTMSNNFPVSSTALNPTYLGGTSDGFITHISANGNTIVGSTYVGTSEYDQCFFVQTDLNDDVFVVGQTEGFYPTTAGVYLNSNSGQFIHKLSNDLSTTLMSTTFGRSSGHVDISISAFLVSDCGPIYVSGWGGSLNGNASVDAHASFSTTAGLPLAGGPFQSTTDGSDFYLIVLDKDAAALNYATYFGGGISSEHVDGGTSRFDKNGKVYQSVCAGCGGNSDFPTTPGAWSNVNPSPNCNLGAFKFDLAFVTPVITATDPYACIPGSYTFGNSSQGANSFFWDFGDGNTSTDFEPTNTYSSPGTYQVMLVGEDTTGCLAPDTTYLMLNVFNAGVATISSVTDTICPDDSTVLNATGGGTYIWSPLQYLDNPTSASPTVYPPITTTYNVIISNTCLDDTLAITVYVYTDSTSTLPDDTICLGDSISLFATGALSYNWYPAINIINANTASPTVFPTNTTTYYVDMLTDEGCTITDTVIINVITTPIPIVSPDSTICIGDSIGIYALGGTDVSWFPGNLVANSTELFTMTSPANNSTIYVDLTNMCGTVRDSINITVVTVTASILSIDTICPGDTVQLEATGGAAYSWLPTNFLSTSTIANPLAFPPVNTTYMAIATDVCGVDTAIVDIIIHESQTSTIPDLTICAGSITTLQAFGGVNYLWYPTTAMINPTSQTPNVAPLVSVTYYVDITTTDGCVITDSVKITTVSSTPIPIITDDISICKGDSIEISAFGASDILWYPPSLVVNSTDSITMTSPNSTTTIYVDLTNICGTVTDSITITVISILPTVVNDTLICPGDTTLLWATGGYAYNWSPTSTLSSPTTNSTYAFPMETTTYSVYVSNAENCSRTLNTTVNVYPIPFVDAGNDVYIEFGDFTNLNGAAFGSYFWDDRDSLSCINCLTPSVRPFETTDYILYVIDENGCEYSDTVTVYLDGVLYVPNAFTPDGDGINEFFTIKGKEIKSFELTIFNRWGELIFTSNSIDDTWDGRHKGSLVQTDTYVWKIRYEDSQNKQGNLVGHVNVLR